MKTVALASLLIAGTTLFGAVAYAEHVVNINTATQAELETLNGIGPSKAQATTGISGDLHATLLYPSGEVAASAGIPVVPSQGISVASASSKSADSGYTDLAAAKSVEVFVSSDSQPPPPAVSALLPAAAAAAGDPKVPLWVYALGLAALMLLSIAVTLYVQTQRPVAATKSLAEEFEIQN